MPHSPHLASTPRIYRLNLPPLPLIWLRLLLIRPLNAGLAEWLNARRLVDKQPADSLQTVIRAGLMAVTLAATGCGDTAHNDAPMPPPNVKAAKAIAQEVREWDEFTGRVAAVNTVEVRARVSGFLEKQHFSAGSTVKRGDLLFVIDQKPFKAQLNFAKAELERAKVKLDLAKTDMKRAENLSRANAISREEYDTRRETLRETSAAVASAEANVYTAQLNLDYSEIRAPIAGRISREMVTVGNLVNAGGDAAVLATIVAIDPVYVYVDADEQSVLKYRRNRLGSTAAADLTGIAVQLALADEPDYPHDGRLDYIAPQENPNTGTISLRGVFANPDGLLSPGLFARMRVQGSQPYQALLLPERAIAADQAQNFVWVVKPDNQLEYRTVTLGARVGPFRAVTSGLNAEDWVVIEGGQKLKAGLSVKPERIELNAQGAP